MPEHITLTEEELTQGRYVIEQDAPTVEPIDKTDRDVGALRDVQTGLDLLQQSLDQRAKEFGVVAPKLERPIFPRVLTDAHFEVLKGVFGSGNLEPFVIPKPGQLTEDYFKMMYPDNWTHEDEVRGLRSFFPRHFLEQVVSHKTGPESETWKDAYLRVFRQESREHRDSIILTESIIKPEEKLMNAQQYGSTEGEDEALDPLLPLIKSVFGPSSNRFAHTHQDITNKLLPAVKEQITRNFVAKGLMVPNFDVILTPALVSNLQTTLFHPENSITEPDEWSCSSLLGQDGSVLDSRIVVGSCREGGAAYVAFSGSVNPFCGFRLSVVIRP